MTRARETNASRVPRFVSRHRLTRLIPKTQVVFTILGGWGLVIFGAKTAFS